MRRLLPVLLLALAGCPKNVPMPKGPAQPQSYKLLADTPEAETASRTEQRPDIFVRTETFQHTPVVVAKGNVGPISLQGGRAQLFGDEAGSKGFSVDNFVLFEVLDAAGKVRHRFTIGFHSGVSVDNQEPDNVGAASFNFEPGVDVTSQLPPEETFTLRATALDFGGIGRVSDVYLRVTPQADRTPSDDELKNR